MFPQLALVFFASFASVYTAAATGGTEPRPHIVEIRADRDTALIRIRETPQGLHFAYCSAPSNCIDLHLSPAIPVSGLVDIIERESKPNRRDRLLAALRFGGYGLGAGVALLVTATLIDVAQTILTSEGTSTASNLALHCIYSFPLLGAAYGGYSGGTPRCFKTLELALGFLIGQSASTNVPGNVQRVGGLTVITAPKHHVTQLRSILERILAGH